MKKLLLLLVSCFVLQQAASQKFRVGVASEVISPPIASFIAGDKQNRKFSGIHDNLYAKAITVQSKQEMVGVLTLDCIGLLYPDVLKIREEIAGICDFPVNRLVVSSTHTHSGPDVVGIWGEDYTASGLDSVYMQNLISKAALAVKRAYTSLQEASGHVAETTFGESWVANICEEEIDRSLNILQFRDTNKKPIATLVNFACHPTFMDAVSSEVSADFLFGLYAESQKELTGEVLFLQGAIGGWIQPKDDEPKTFERAYQRGSEMAATVTEALKKPVKLKKSEIHFRSTKLNIPVENPMWAALSQSGIIDRNVGTTVETEITYFKIGEASFVSHPGETAPYYSLESKKLMDKGPKFILGLGNDALGYILKPAYFEDATLPHAAYLTRMSVGKDTGAIMLESIKNLISGKK